MELPRRFLHDLLLTLMQNPVPQPEPRKAFQAPTVRREAPMPVCTAGSFDLFIPNK